MHVTPGDLPPIERIALDIARADMHYVTCALIGLPGSAAAAESALVQYGAMSAYEAQVHFDRTLGWQLEAAWDPRTAKAARMSGKFFADSKRNLDGVVAHFDALLRANHGAFYPPDRRGKLFDFLRDDMSVVLLDGLPYTTLVSAHFFAGLAPEEVADLETVGPAMGRTSYGIANIARAILLDSEIAPHGHGPAGPFEALDGKIRIAFPLLFAGAFEPAVAAAMISIQSMAASAQRSHTRALCAWCDAAARKHRFVALFQSLTALRIASRDGLLPRSADLVASFLDEPESSWVLGQARLRNGLVHLGLQDIAGDVGAGSDAGAVVLTYTGEEPDAFATRVSLHLARLVETLTAWMLSPGAGGKDFLGALRPPPD